MRTVRVATYRWRLRAYGKELTMFVDRTESYIVSNESLLGGEPVIRGTVTPVRAIVEMWRMGVPPNEIPMHLPHITLAQVFDALRYYAEHQPEINQTIQANRVPDAQVHPAVQLTIGTERPNGRSNKHQGEDDGLGETPEWRLLLH